MIRQKSPLTKNTLLKSFWPVCIILLAISASQVFTLPRTTNEVIPRVDTGTVVDTLPLSFVANVVQSRPGIRFTVRSLGGTLLFSPREVVFNLNNPNVAGNEIEGSKALSILFENGNPDVLIEGQEKRTGIVNYFLGNDPAHWYTNVPTYGSISYTNLYPGIDLHYEGREGQLKSTYFVAPYTDPRQIGWQYQGANDVHIEVETGDLLIYTGDPETSYILREQAPVAWQNIENNRQIVEVRYTMIENGKIGFSLGAYDPAYPLIIDPMLLTYSTYLGGTDLDWGESIAVDSSGNIYVSGATFSDDFPTRNAYDHSLAVCGVDAFITKIDPTQNGDDSLIYSTYLGGSGNCANENGLGIAVDSAGNAYITGFVQSNDFPTTVNAYDTTKGNGIFGDDTSNDVFVTKLSPAGNVLLYSTYLGGDEGVDDIGHGIAVDDTGNAYVVGLTLSDDYPTQNAYQSSRNGSGIEAYDSFVTKLDTTQSGTSSLIYSSYLGGSSSDVATGIVADNTGKVYISGRTDSTDFPTINAYQNSYGGGNSDVFVAELDTTESGASSLVYSSYLGGDGHDGDDDTGFSGSYIGGITQDGTGNIYLTGGTQSSNFPTKNAYQSSNAGGYDAFVAKLNLTQSGEDSLIFSTYLGGTSDDFGYELVANTAGNVFVTGSTESTNFPTRYAYQSNYNGNGDAFVTAFDVPGTSLWFSTYFGGSEADEAADIAVDSVDNVYLTGATSSGNFPIQNAYDSSLDGDADGFVTKLASSPSLVINHNEGKPGSYFILTGCDYPANGTATITINGATLGNMQVDNFGCFVFELSSSLADDGSYFVTVTVNPSVTTSFRIDSNSPNTWISEGAGTSFSVPAGIAFTEYNYLPIIFR